ncbi:MAG: hypothetical protein JXR59_06625 [Desulfuromonadaceae bacterium]|nr:hypothetical protein [Desulfuromonadaceae bacterium]
MKKLLLLLVAMFGVSTSALAADFTFHGDFNNTFRLLSSHAGFFKGGGGNNETLGHKTLITDDSYTDFFGCMKYRLWTEVASDDGAVKGVYAIEFGGTHFGENTNSKGEDKGGDFSGDGINVETRWAYTDFALAGGRARIGLMPVKVSNYLWNETATGVHYRNGIFEGAWYRGYEVVNTDDSNDFKDLDALYARCTVKPDKDTKIGLFGLWQTSDADTVKDGVTAPTSNYLKKLTAKDLDLYTLGLDGSLEKGKFFAKWDLLYQFGDYAEEYDFGGYFFHVDLGAKLGKGKVTYTFWYASGDDNASDGDLDAFIATDCDTKGHASSVILFEGFTNDDYFSAVPYVQDKGLILNRLAYDYTLTDKLKVGIAALYLMTAEDIGNDSNGDGKVDQYGDDKIGFELDAYVTYKLFSSLELALEVGYLAADDAMDYFEVEQDGKSDEDLYTVNSHIHYKF